MIEERLEDFCKHVTMINDKISEYVNEEKGLRYCLNTSQLLCRVDRLELTSGKNPIGELEIAKFKQQIENKDYTITDIIKHVPKSDVTKDDKDKFTIIEKKTKGVILYNVSNQLGIHNTYENQEEAFEKCEEFNKDVFNVLCK